MVRVTSMAIVATALAGCMPFALEGELGASTKLANMTPDLNFIPKAGNQGVLYALSNGAPDEQVAVLKDITAYDRYQRALKEDDTTELAELEAQKWLQWTPIVTGVFIAKVYDRSHTGAPPAAEVRILDGPLKGQTCLASLLSIARLKKVEVDH
jgi:hypothetical protein